VRPHASVTAAGLDPQTARDDGKNIVTIQHMMQRNVRCTRVWTSADVDRQHAGTTRSAHALDTSPVPQALTLTLTDNSWWWAAACVDERDSTALYVPTIMVSSEAACACFSGGGAADRGRQRGAWAAIADSEGTRRAPQPTILDETTWLRSGNLEVDSSHAPRQRQHDKRGPQHHCRHRG
jgi:hypothetical protein